MRAGGLSDDRVIEIINEFYVATAVNVTRDGFPAHDIPALAYVQQVFASNWRFEFGFGSCFAVDDSGHIPLGMPGPKGDMDDNFGAGRYVDFLIQALERHKQLKHVRGAFMRGDMAGGIAGAQALTADLIATMQRSAVANAALANTLQSNVPADFASQRDR